jgi:predicted RNA-binding protein YlqC (UPF0109 family)
MGLLNKIARLIKIYPNSIEVNKTTRGYTYTIKLRCDSGDEDKLIDEIKRLETRLKESFPGAEDK